jgi:adenosine deaminase
MHIANRKRNIIALLLFLALPNCVSGQGRGSVNEAKTARYFTSIQNDPLMLLPFLRQMPKGGDLHNHLGGAIYAESFVQWAADSGLCVDQNTLSVSNPPCDMSAGKPPAANALKDPTLYRRMIDAWSMRNWEKSGQSGHDHFFDTFGKFGAAGGPRFGEMLAEATTRAAGEGVSYLELMSTLDGFAARQVGINTGWDDDFAAMRAKMLANGLPAAIAAGRKAADDAEAKYRSMLGCGTPAAKPGCNVEIRYLYQVSRGAPREQVFAQILTGFEMASQDPRVVGLNLVQPEDWLIPMQDFSLHMRMLDYLHSQYPKVHITLHAGELAPGMVPPEGLRFHVRESVDVGHAERIGHGVDIMHEDDPIELLQKMARRNILVEICLTSNDVILGIHGREHPLRLYLKYGVPVTLASDDLGVSRSDMTGEYLRAVLDQGLNYQQLKTMARDSLTYSFAAGSNLWLDVRHFVPVKQCAAGWGAPACKAFQSTNEKARLQVELERSFTAFERKF